MEITAGKKVSLDDFPVCYNTAVEVHRTYPSARPWPATESGVQSKTRLLTSPFLQNTGVHFHQHFIFTEFDGRCFMQSVKCCWRSYRLCLRDNKSTSTKSVCRCLDSLMRLRNEAMVWHVCYLLGKWSKISCVIEPLKSAAQVQEPKRLQASQPSPTPAGLLSFPTCAQQWFQIEKKITVFGTASQLFKLHLSHTCFSFLTSATCCADHGQGTSPFPSLFCLSELRRLKVDQMLGQTWFHGIVEGLENQENRGGHGRSQTQSNGSDSSPR